VEAVDLPSKWTIIAFQKPFHKEKTVKKKALNKGPVVGTKGNGYK